MRVRTRSAAARGAAVVTAPDPSPICSLRVVIAHRHAIYRHGLTLQLRAAGVEVIAQLELDAALAERLRDTAPDVLVIDMRADTLLDVGTLAATVRVVALVDDATSERAAAAVHHGASAVVDRTCGAEALVAAVRASAAGAAWYPPALQRTIATRLRQPAAANLTRTEYAVVALVAAGMKNAEIALRLHVSDDTVKKHLNHIFAKLDEVRDRVGLVLWGIRHGVMEHVDS
jgi:DNA-binding NarL/FixJ family response regulator